MNNIGIYNETDTVLEELDGLKGLLEFALKYQNLTNVDFNVILVSEDKIHEINKKYRGIDRPTDVISFALEDNKDIEYDNYLPESIVDLEFQYHNLEKYINNMMNI